MNVLASSVLYLMLRWHIRFCHQSGRNIHGQGFAQFPILLAAGPGLAAIILVRRVSRIAIRLSRCAYL